MIRLLVWTFYPPHDRIALRKGRTDPLRMTPTPPQKLIGYASPVSAPEATVDAQVATLERELGAELVDVLLEDASSDETLSRPVLRRALWMIADGQADGLAVAALDRLTTSVVDLGDLLEWLRDANARFIALDRGIDTAQPVGRKMRDLLIHVAEWPRRLTSQRTKAGMAAVRARGGATGRPGVPPEVVHRIRELHAQELSLQAIAATLDAEGIPTARGAKKWRPSAIQNALGYERPAPPKPRRRPELPPLSGD